MTFNVAGSTLVEDPTSGQALADQIASANPDFAALQECVDCSALLDKMPPGYALADGFQDSELGILYAAASWDVVQTGVIAFGDDDGWGLREARWARMRHLESGAEVYVYSTHFCVTIRSTSDTCDVDRQLEYASRLLADIGDRDRPVVVGGDFNVFDGFESGPVISDLTHHGLVDTLREVSDAPVTTFVGNSWAPAGRIDYVFATPPVAVTAASVAQESASDHRPVSASLVFE